MRLLPNERHAVMEQHRSGESRHEDVHAGDAFVLHDMCARTATCGTTNEGIPGMWHEQCLVSPE
jgi:hypothetical protein